MTLTDGLERTVNLQNPPQRVVSIAPGATHIMRAAGGLSSLVAITSADYREQDLAGLPRISALPLDLEAIVALDPDLVLASDQVNDPSHADLFDALDIPIVYLGSASWEAVLASIRMTGDMMGTSEQATSMVDSLAKKRDELMAKTAAPGVRPTAVFLISPIQSYSFGAGSYVLDLMRWAGLDPITSSFDTPAPVLDDEWVLMHNPDVIIGSFGEDDAKDALLNHHPTWQSLDAIRNDRIFSIPAADILTPGPRNLQAASQMARSVHPHLFEVVATRTGNESLTTK